MTELFIKNIISEIMFGNRICESLEDRWIVNYLYDYLLCEKLLYGQPLTIVELRNLLRQKILHFQFIKLDGEVRDVPKGTLMMKYVPQSDHPKGIRPSSPKVATFYDLEKFDWRSVSQKSKEIVLKKDEETGKPVIMVKDKPEPGDMAVGDTGVDQHPEPTPKITPEITPDDTTIDTGEQPDLTIDGEPVDYDTKKPLAQVKGVKPIESTENKEYFHFINPDTGASQDIEMTAKEAVKQLKKMGRGWKLRDKNEFAETENRIEAADKEEGDYLSIGDKRNYLNRKGENVPIEITGEDTEGGFYAKTDKGVEFKIPANKMQNIGQHIKRIKPKTKLTPKNIINKEENLDNLEASTI